MSFETWNARYCYDGKIDGYFDTKHRLTISRRHFDARYAGIPCVSIHDSTELVEASVLFDQLQPFEVSGTTFVPGGEAVVNGKGNRWMDARRPGVDGDAEPWLNLVKLLIPGKKAREHVLDWMAFKVQFPDRKVNHAILHYGASGCGKSMMWLPFFYAVGQVRYVLDADNFDLHSEELETEVLVFDQLNQKHDPQFANRLKPLRAAPPLALTIYDDHGGYEIPNRISVVALTSCSNSIKLTDDDRRWFYIHSQAPALDRIGEIYARERFYWYENEEGYDIVARYLQTRDVSKFNTGPAPKTDEKKTLIENGRSDEEAAVHEMLENNETGIVAGPLSNVVAEMSEATGLNISRNDLLLALCNAGWIDRGVVNKSRLFLTPRRLFCRPDLADKSNTELRLLIEKPIN
jgi:hypothetical protein